MKKLGEILQDFSELVLENFGEVQSIKIVVIDKMKKKTKFKKFREYGK
ncbi:hypothetical protein LCGC14_1257100 [marine sediment metagenome]|uniref:Uncharacterized protein n=1 Tax=marine sediment metagenome TaxID=412755 RepID=A0A0F9L1N3_9ZZZZ